MEIPIISKLWEPRAGTKNSLWGNAYAQIIRDGRGKVIFFLPSNSCETFS